ncbi:hypothetical protein AB1L30_05455 [Bremerella sp. JC817]|uniref:hypothetical protein n=1 Tax=Bremerella sp. JC817 TaxID=3231756 RepID=UPI003458FB4F
MKGSSLVVLSGVALVAYSLIAPRLPGSGITPPPINPGGPDLLTVFSQSDQPQQAAADACEFGCLCESIAEMIDFDGHQTEPQLSTGQQLDNFRKLSRFYQLHGASYAQRYPALADVAGSYLQNELGNDGGKIEPARRARWIAAYRTLATSAHYASDYLEWK